MRDLKIGTSWVRGVVGEALTPELAIGFARAFGTWIDGGPVLLGRDTRRSSTMIGSAVVSGLLASGCEVFDLGLSSTPLVSFAVREMGAGGGISVTGSHNDARWNALKFIGPDGALLNSVKSEELLDIYHAASFLSTTSAVRRPRSAPEDLTDRYVEYLLSILNAEPIRKRRYRVAVDFCSGPLASPTSLFLDRLNCVLVPLNANPSGIFPRPPAPSARNMAQLAETTLQARAALGAAMNVDGDRVAFVTEAGRPLSEEMTLPLATMNRLRRRPGSVVTNLSTSSQVEHVARAYGQTVMRTPVGESHVVDRGLEEGAVLSGEGSGGIAVLPVAMTFDAILTLGQVLELMTEGDATATALVAEIPETHMRKGEVRCQAPDAYRAMERFRLRFRNRDAVTLDGVRVDWEDGAWVHVRVSKTEPVIRVISEAPDPVRADRVFTECMALAREAVKGV
jgi:phosphomannomutase